MKIGLYFGSFNPIHVGHLVIANHIANNTSLDQIWFVVSPQNPLKGAGSLLNKFHRKYLIDIAIDGEKKLKSSTIEFSLPIPSFTVDTLTYLREKYPDHLFSVIMGSDSLKNITKWKNYEQIVNNYEILVYERPGFKTENNFGKNIIMLNAPLLDISSSKIREMIKTGKSIKFLLPDVVKEEIEKNHYYK